MQRLLFFISLCLLGSGALAKEPDIDVLQSTCTWKQSQEVLIQEMAFQYLLKAKAQDWPGVRHILVATGGQATRRCLKNDGYTAVAQEPSGKERRVCFVVNIPKWRDSSHVLIAVEVDYINPGQGPCGFDAGIFEPFTLRLRRRADHWQVSGVKDGLTMVATKGKVVPKVILRAV